VALRLLRLRSGQVRSGRSPVFFAYRHRSRWGERGGGRRSLARGQLLGIIGRATIHGGAGVCTATGGAVDNDVDLLYYGSGLGRGPMFSYESNCWEYFRLINLGSCTN